MTRVLERVVKFAGYSTRVLFVFQLNGNQAKEAEIIFSVLGLDSVLDNMRIEGDTRHAAKDILIPQ